MPFVIDASVAAFWLLADESHPVADAALEALSEDRASAPQLWWHETRNLLLVNERRKRLDAVGFDKALRTLAAIPVELNADVDEDVLIRIARSRRLTAYDAAYLELALRLGCPLATLDTALAKAAVAEGVRLVGQAD
jgi:predicted nucleic acid-binding protein